MTLGQNLAAIEYLLNLLPRARILSKPEIRSRKVGGPGTGVML